MAERLRREAQIEHPDTRIHTTGTPAATLQHVLTSCRGAPGAAGIRQKLVQALTRAEEAVPLKQADVSYNKAYRRVMHEARTLLQAADAAGLPEEGWSVVEKVLAGCVPDFGRNAERKERQNMVQAVIAAV